MAEKNGKWQLAFWIMSGVFMSAIVFMANNVIANDKASRQRDTEITEKVVEQHTKVVEKIQVNQEETNAALTKILVAIAEIKAKVQ